MSTEETKDQLSEDLEVDAETAEEVKGGMRAFQAKHDADGHHVQGDLIR